MRLLKLMRILRLSRKMANVDLTRHMNPAVVRLFKLLAKIVFAAHLLGCMWFMVDECDVDSGDDAWKTCGGSSLQSKVSGGGGTYQAAPERCPGELRRAVGIFRARRRRLFDARTLLPTSSPPVLRPIRAFATRSHGLVIGPIVSPEARRYRAIEQIQA